MIDSYSLYCCKVQFIIIHDQHCQLHVCACACLYHARYHCFAWVESGWEKFPGDFPIAARAWPIDLGMRRQKTRVAIRVYMTYFLCKKIFMVV